MATVIRMQRGGRTHAPYYRVVVMDSRIRDRGRIVEQLGIYQPCARPEPLIEMNQRKALEWLYKGARLSEDTAIGIIFSGMFALGIALISSVGSYAVDLTHFLFGNVLAVSQSDLILTAVLAVGVIVIVIGFYKEFMVLVGPSGCGSE